MTDPHVPAPNGEVPDGTLPTRVLADRYELGQVLGSGGWAVVHSAYDRRLTRTVAVKVLRPELAASASVRARFRREAQSAARLNHPSIVSVHDTSDEGPEPFIVMEHVPGTTLREMMPEGRALPIGQALAITTGVLTALEYAHEMGIVHRDIKPGNIMITPQGVVKVMDFGIARAMNDDMTITMTVIGTPAYLSPEHADGQLVDTRSDLYSTGCVLFEMLTGRLPFLSDSPFVVARQHIQEPAPVPSTLNPALPPVLDQVVAKAMAKDRETRYQTAAEFRSELVLPTGAISGLRKQAPPRLPQADPDPTLAATQEVSPPTPGAPGASRPRRRWVGLAAGLAAALLIVGAVAFALRPDDATKPGDTTAQQVPAHVPNSTGHDAPETAVSTCVVGEWKVDNYSISKAFAEANPGSSANSTSGSYRFVFNEDGTLDSAWKMTVRTYRDRNVENAALTADVTEAGQWSGTDHNLTFVFTRRDGTLTYNGQDKDIRNEETWTGSCLGSKLVVTPSRTSVFGGSTLTLTRLGTGKP
ncbi:MAG: protein kinase [Micrococcales bacterium]|nr:protein kinase [Micrococcales bacterium]MCL2667289.1 protein kinase [Micrococcales bacterium]